MASTFSRGFGNLASHHLRRSQLYFRQPVVMEYKSYFHIFSTQEKSLIKTPDVSCIGFVGLGNLGSPTARFLVAQGYRVIVHDVNSEAVDKMVQCGALGAASIKELAAKATLVMSMLPRFTEVKNVYFGNDGVLANLKKPGAYILEASTIGPVSSLELYHEANKFGHQMIDIPVSGGVTAAEAGTLTYMVGAGNEQFRHIEPFLKRIGRTVLHCGDASKGQAVKVCNNLILGCTMIGVSEGFRLAESLGVNARTFNNVVNTSTARSWSSEMYNPVPGIMPNVPASREYRGGFALSLMAKDLEIALDAAKTVNAPLPATEVVEKMYSNLNKQGYGQYDFGCVYLYNK